MKSRLRRLYSRLKEHKIGGLLVNKDVNISYLSGFRGSEALALISKEATNFLITDFKYAEAVKDEVIEFDIKVRNGSIYGILRELCRKLRIKRLGFESRWLTHSEHAKLRNELKPLELIPTFDLVEALREIKEDAEINLLKVAASISDRTHKFLLGLIKPGMCEEEVAREIDHFLRLCGAETNSFPTIVTSGKRSSLPHGRPTSKEMGPNDPVLIDLGARYEGYNSDLTRMVFLGRISRKFRLIYDWLVEAQAKAICKIRPGVRISDIDGAARRYLVRKGIGKYFPHGLGHGLGREIHENPLITQTNRANLKEGMVFTVEPAVYIPGWGGIRIEDMILVTKNGAKILSSSTRQIINIK